MNQFLFPYLFLSCIILVIFSCWKKPRLCVCVFQPCLSTPHFTTTHRHIHQIYDLVFYDIMGYYFIFLLHFASYVSMEKYPRFWTIVDYFPICFRMFRLKSIPTSNYIFYFSICFRMFPSKNTRT